MPEGPSSASPSGVWGMAPRIDLADAELLEQRHPLVGPRQPEADAVEVGGEQRTLQRPVGPVDPGRLGAVLLVDADEARLLLLAHVARDVVVADHGQLVLQPGELLADAGEEVAVQHVGQRRRQTHHGRHLRGVAAGGVDDVFGDDGAGLGDDVEAAVGAATDLEHPVAAAEGRTPGAGRRQQGVGGPGGVHVAVVGGPDGAHDAVEGVERVPLGDEAGVDPVHAVAHVVGQAQLAPEPVHLDGFVGHAEAAAVVPRHAGAAGGLEAGVQLAGVLAEGGERVARDRVRHLAGGVPGAAGGRLGLLHQQGVGPALGGQVVEQRGAADPPADDDDLRGVGERHGRRLYHQR